MGHKPPIPERLSREGKDFLSHCLESDPKMRWTASQLLDHSFVKVGVRTFRCASCLHLALRNTWKLRCKTLGLKFRGTRRPAVGVAGHVFSCVEWSSWDS